MSLQNLQNTKNKLNPGCDARVHAQPKSRGAPSPIIHGRRAGTMVLLYANDQQLRLVTPARPLKMAVNVVPAPRPLLFFDPHKDGNGRSYSKKIHRGAILVTVSGYLSDAETERHATPLPSSRKKSNKSDHSRVVGAYLLG